MVVTLKLANVAEAIQRSMIVELDGQNMFFNVIDSGDSREFLEFVEQFSKQTFVDAIGGRMAPDGARRYRTDLSFSDVIKTMTEDNLGAGIKTYHRPLTTMNEWEAWDGGYIEGFVRGMRYNLDYEDIIIWQYVPMVHLEEILVAFSGRLAYYE